MGPIIAQTVFHWQLQEGVFFMCIFLCVDITEIQLWIFHCFFFFFLLKRNREKSFQNALGFFLFFFGCFFFLFMQLTLVIMSNSNSDIQLLFPLYVPCFIKQKMFILERYSQPQAKLSCCYFDTEVFLAVLRKWCVQSWTW